MIAQELEVSLHMAFVEARQQRHEFITVEHLLLALLDNPSAAEVLRACSANVDDLRKSLTNFIKDNTPQVAGTDEVDTQPTLGFQRVIQRAIMHVQSTGNGKKEVTGANVLVAIFGEKDSHAVYYLHQQGVTRLDVVNFIAHGIRKSDPPEAAKSAEAPSNSESEESSGGERNEKAPGAAVFAGMEGTRPVLVEVQALVAATSLGTPRRAVVGWDSSRLAMILAVLEAHCGVRLGQHDVYLNVAGGYRIREPAADMAIAAALVSSLAGLALPADCVYFGEVSLSGAVRPVAHTAQRLKEAEKLGFSAAVLPAASPDLPKGSQGKWREVDSLPDLVAQAVRWAAAPH